MKRFFSIVTIATLVLIGKAQAFDSSSVILDISRSTLSNDYFEGVRVQIDSKGNVAKIVTKKSKEENFDHEVVGKISKANLKKVNGLLEQAEWGEFQKINGGFRCLGPSLYSYEVVGFVNDLEVHITRKGLPCGNKYENTSAAGQQLIQAAELIWKRYSK